MLKFREGVKLYVSMHPMDARKSIDGLCALVANHFADNPQSGNIFIFFNKAKDKVKLLWWHANGFVLFYKRLEKNHFVLPKNTTDTFEITSAQLHGLLVGLDFSLMRHFPEINYHQYV